MAAALTDGLTVEFDDEVDDSRTGGRPSRVESPLSAGLFVTGGLLFRVGLCCLTLGVVPEVIMATAGEYEEQELGVGTWLKGESV
jgi:hypothetical protein